MSAPPAIRGFVTSMILDATRALPDEPRRRVFALVPEPTLALIEATSRLGWIPMDESMKLTDAIHGVLGNPGYRRFFSRLADRIIDAPLLQSFFDAAVRLFGLTPQALFKWSTHAWDQAFRHIGRLTYQLQREGPDGGRIEMVWEDIPPLMLRGGTFEESLAGTFEMFLRRVSREGHVRIRPASASEKSRRVYEVTWK